MLRRLSCPARDSQHAHACLLFTSALQRIHTRRDAQHPEPPHPARQAAASLPAHGSCQCLNAVKHSCNRLRRSHSANLCGKQAPV